MSKKVSLKISDGTNSVQKREIKAHFWRQCKQKKMTTADCVSFCYFRSKIDDCNCLFVHE